MASSSSSSLVADEEQGTGREEEAHPAIALHQNPYLILLELMTVGGINELSAIGTALAQWKFGMGLAAQLEVGGGALSKKVPRNCGR